MIQKMGIIFNHTPSLPLGFYQTTREPVKRQSIVQFCPPKIATDYKRNSHSIDEKEVGSLYLCAGQSVPYLKYVVGLPGDRIEVKKTGVSINGNPVLKGSIPLVEIKKNEFNRLPNLIGKKWILKKNQYWAWTPEWFSFDSRYYGPITDVTTIRPILVYTEKINSEIPKNIQKEQVTKK